MGRLVAQDLISGLDFWIVRPKVVRWAERFLYFKISMAAIILQFA